MKSKHPFLKTEEKSVSSLKNKAGVNKKVRKKPVKKQDTGPDMFTLLVRQSIGIELIKELKFHPVRRYRFDYANEENKIAIESDGGIWRKGGGAHSRPQNIERDMEKINLAQSLGWRVIRVKPQDLCKIATLDLIKQLINNRTL